MRKMKDSGIEWIGEIPSDWDVKKLKYLCKNITDGSHFSPETQLDGKTYITVTDVYDGVVHYESASKISERDFEVLEKNGCKPPIHSVLLAKDGTVGRTAIVEYNDYVVLSSLGILNPDENEVYYVFLKHLLDSQFLQEQMKLAMAGSALRRITIGKINKLITIVPPLPEQKKIADFLDAKCADIDQIRADIEKQIEILTDYKKSVITEAVTKGLNPKAKLKDSGIEWIGKIPEGWNVKKLKYVTKIRTEKAHFSPDKDLYIGLENIVSWSNKLIETETEYIAAQYDVCKKGDVLFSKLRPYLAKAVISPKDAFCTGELLNFKFFDGEKKFLWYYLLLEQFVEIVNASTYGAKMPRANADFIINQPIMLPPLPEQKAIANYLDEKCSEIEATIAEKQKQLETLEEYKKSLIFEYVTGKKEVPA